MIKGLTANVRGLKTPAKMSGILSWVKNAGCDFIFLQETNIGDEKETFQITIAGLLGPHWQVFVTESCVILWRNDLFVPGSDVEKLRLAQGRVALVSGEVPEIG